MPKFNCSYAYDVPFYLDFAVEAETEEQALKKCEEALANGAFDEVCGEAEACYENQDNDRVFVSGPADDNCGRTLDDIVKDSES